MKQYILRAFVLSTLVAVSATNAMASNTSEATILTIQNFAPESNVTQLNHRQVSTLMNVISSGDDSAGDKRAMVRLLIEKFENGLFAG